MPGARLGQQIHRLQRRQLVLHPQLRPKLAGIARVAADDGVDAGEVLLGVFGGKPKPVMVIYFMVISWF